MVKFVVKSLHNISEFLLWRSIDISELSMKIDEYFKEDEDGSTSDNLESSGTKKESPVSRTKNIDYRKLRENNVTVKSGYIN